jgi:hypothetical protein
MMAGNGPEPDGLLIVTEKEIDLPLSETVMLRVLPEYDAVTLDGLGGRVPSSYLCIKALISLCLQVQSALLVTFCPPAKVKGSGRVEIETLTLPGMLGHEVGDVDIVLVLEAVVVTGVDCVVPTLEVLVEDLDVLDEVAPGKHW